MNDPFRVLLLDRQWANHRLVNAAVREQFPRVAVYSAGSVAQAIERLACTRFDLILVEAALKGSAVALTSEAPSVPVEVFDMTPAVGAAAEAARVQPPAPRAAEVAKLVEQHLKG